MVCKIHSDGWHKTLITTKEINKDGQILGRVRHQCVCWLPSDLAGSGIHFVDPLLTAYAEEVHLWKDGEVKRNG